MIFICRWLFLTIIHAVSKSRWPNKVTRPAAAIKSLRFALLQMIPMYRLWLHRLFRRYGTHCLLSEKRAINLITHSRPVLFTIIPIYIMIYFSKNTLPPPPPPPTHTHTQTTPPILFSFDLGCFILSDKQMRILKLSLPKVFRSKPKYILVISSVPADSNFRFGICEKQALEGYKFSYCRPIVKRVKDNINF